MRIKCYDAQINVYARGKNGRRSIVIVFAGEGERKLTEGGKSFLERLNVVEGAMAKSLDVHENEHGRFIPFEADDADLAEDEARDLQALLQEHADLTSRIVVSRRPPPLFAATGD